MDVQECKIIFFSTILCNMGKQMVYEKQGVRFWEIHLSTPIYLNVKLLIVEVQCHNSFCDRSCHNH